MTFKEVIITWINSLQPNVIRPAVAVLNRCNHRTVHTPLVPHAMRISASIMNIRHLSAKKYDTFFSPPDADGNGLPLPHLHGVAQRDKQREPTEHAFSVGGGQDGQRHVLIQSGLEVSHQAVHRHADGRHEGHCLEP
jgi:hypothetical protein